MRQPAFPPLPLEEWRDTRDTIHRYAQILGQIRRSLTPPQKHSWHVSLEVTAVGLTTTPVFVDGRFFEVVMDFADHQAHIVTSDGQRRAFSMVAQSPSTFCQQIKTAFAELGLVVDFDEGLCADAGQGVYDVTAVSHFWQALVQITAVFTTFKHGMREESGPIRLWPHHFDLALLWFSGRLVPDQDPNNPEYADEQMNFGFVTGDEAIAQPYFYATAYPTPATLTSQSLPDAAYWHSAGWTGAILPYEVLTTVENPHEMLLGFLQIAHQAGAQFMRDA